MTLLIIQIPCFNEAETLPVTLRDLPRALPGITRIETLIIDDGSSDETAAIAAAHGVDHIVRLPRNKGLANAFRTGLDAALRAGADIIVNTDADNQYVAGDIEALVAPILAGRAEIVVGARPIASIRHFSPLKKAMQKLGSLVVRLASGTNIPDAPSGFRAFSRAAAMRLNIFSEFSYTLETVIQAGQKGMAIDWVPVSVNADLRPSRLVRGLFDYIRRSVVTIIRIFITYRPLRFFFALGLVFLIPALIIGLRFLLNYLGGDGSGMIQSLILAGALGLAGFFLIVAGVIADLIAVNRKLLEDVRTRLIALELAAPGQPPQGRAVLENVGLPATNATQPARTGALATGGAAMWSRSANDPARADAAE